MSDENSQMPVGTYEGYQVFQNEGEADIKQEPDDSEFEKISENQEEENGGRVGNVRTLLKQTLEKKSKEMSVKSVVENIVQQNEVLLAQNNAKALKPITRTIKRKAGGDVPFHGSIVTPKDPTVGCSMEDLPDVNDALIEVAVNKANKSKFDPDLVCAVGSKIILMTPQGQPLQMDVTYYWCNFCSYRSEQKALLLQHVIEHRFHCKFCTFQSFSRRAVIHHCTEEHSEFSETASTLKYCTYLPDLLRKTTMTKMQQDGGEDVPSSKRARFDEPEPHTTTTGQVGSSLIPTVVYRTETEPGKSGDEHFENSGRENDGLPVISSVVSGKEALSAVLKSSKPPKTVPQKNKQPQPSLTGVTVSSGLCWNCGYCQFVTLSQSFLKVHLNSQHRGKPHKYVAMLVSSEEEMNEIKASDAKLGSSSSSGLGIVPVNPVKVSDLLSASTGGQTTLPGPSNKQPSTSGIEIDDAEKDSPEKTPEELEEEKRIPVSFKCAHCNFSAPQKSKVRIHLFQRHSGCVIYALDMKAVKLRQKRYIFFCLDVDCSFQTKETDEYLDHISKCTPWLDGDWPNVDAGIIKSLELTKTFIEKTANAVGLGNDFRKDKMPEYACIYCTYISNNNTRLKKHVIANHSDKGCIMKDAQAGKSHAKSTVYFCQHCLWETRDGSELELHLVEKHSSANTSKEPPSKTDSTNFAESNINQSSPADNASETARQASALNKKKQQEHAKSEENDSSASDADVKRSDMEENKEDETTVEENEYEGIVPDEVYDRAMSAYIESDNPESNSGRGRSSRKAALKCRIKVKRSVKAPPLYKCIHCSEFHFGTNLMRAHLRQKHKNQPLRAVDVLKQEKKNPHFFICFCPADKCTYFEPIATDIVNHAKNKHGIKATHTDLIRIMNVFSAPQASQATTSRGGRLATASTGESYECLYCTESKIYHSRKDMKKHLTDQHTEEEFIFRDCIARKLRQPSRFYMCHNMSCDFTSEKQNNYLLHMLAHQKAKIYECSKCQWFTSIRRELLDHFKNMHDDRDATILEIDLDLDALGNTLKMVDGTVIKSEK